MAVSSAHSSLMTINTWLRTCKIDPSKKSRGGPEVYDARPLLAAISSVLDTLPNIGKPHILVQKNSEEAERQLKNLWHWCSLEDRIHRLRKK